MQSIATPPPGGQGQRVRGACALQTKVCLVDRWMRAFVPHSHLFLFSVSPLRANSSKTYSRALLWASYIVPKMPRSSLLPVAISCVSWLSITNVTNDVLQYFTHRTRTKVQSSQPLCWEISNIPALLSKWELDIRSGYQIELGEDSCSI